MKALIAIGLTLGFAAAAPAQEVSDTDSTKVEQRLYPASQSALIGGLPASTQTAEISPKPEVSASKMEKNLYSISKWTAIAATGWDSFTTARALTRPLHASYTICPAGDCHSATVTQEFLEKGWEARMLGAKGPRSVIGLQFGITGVTLLVGEVLHRKGGKWATVGSMLNGSRAAASIHAGAHNTAAMRAAERDLVPPGATNVVRW